MLTLSVLKTKGLNEYVYSFEGLPVLYRTIYGEGSEPELILLLNHSERNRALVEKYPFLLEPFNGNEQLFFDYLDLERDNGADILAEKIAEIWNGGRLDIVQVNLPRGIVDTNRHWKFPELALRGVVDENNEDTDDILQLHRAAILAITMIIETLKEGGLFVDLHTMNKSSLLKDPDLAPDLESVKQYFKYYADANDLEYERVINFIGTIQYKDELHKLDKGEMILSNKLLENLKKLYDLEGVPWVMDKPYHPRGRFTSTAYCLQRPNSGMWLDYPISFLSKKCCNVHPELCDEKIAFHAAVMTEALKRTQGF